MQDASQQPAASNGAQLKLTDRPNDADVLLGRGLGINRHPGNENFRAIVSQHAVRGRNSAVSITRLSLRCLVDISTLVTLVHALLRQDAYMASTKRQKMMISRSVVEKVHELDPPGRFLQQSHLTGLWHEVDVKRALEKAAQGLRDAAAQLRKQLAQAWNGHVIEVRSDTETEMNLVRPVRSFSRTHGYLPRLKNPPDPDVCDAMLHQVPPSPQSWDQPSTTVTSANNLNFQLMRPISAQSAPDELMPRPSIANSSIHNEQWQDIQAARGSVVTVGVQSNVSNFPNSAFTPRLSNGDVIEDSPAANARDENAIYEEEFTRDMGPDEYFVGLCEPICGFDDSIFD